MKRLRSVAPGLAPVTRLPAPVERLKPALSRPVDADETHLRMRAQSLLSGIRFFDGSTACPPLTLAQARDVIAWYRPAS